MLLKEEFDVLYHIVKQPRLTQEKIATAINLKLEKVDNIMISLQKHGYLSEDGQITKDGLLALEPYKVKNAIILAAGFASRCAPLSYEKPKGLFIVKGEVLIERQIKQLQERGINTIYVVVGYKKEQFFYLEKKYGVKIIVNTEYTQKNNLSSVYAAKEYFGNSYICYSDNYLNINGYEQYVYKSYFAAMYSKKYTDEYVIKYDPNGLICQYYQGDTNCWYQMGEMYFSYETADCFLNFLEKEYQYPSIFDMKIDDFYIRHLSKIDIYIKQYPADAFLEFDTVAEIKQFDDKFIQNMGENILSIICENLNCTDEDIVNIQQIKRGLTNIIFSFECKGKKYIYRHPGVGTNKIIDRSHEFNAQIMAKEMELDPSLISCNPKKGWKICEYLENIPFDYNSSDDEARGVELIRKMHSGSKHKLGWDFNMVECAQKIQNKLSEDYYEIFDHFDELKIKIRELYEFVNKDGVEHEMCHNDVCANNILLGKNKAYLIDWEYAGDNDPAADIASFIINHDYSYKDVDRILQMYFERGLKKEEIRHYYAYIAISAYFYFSWGIYMENAGVDIGEFSYLWFKYASYYGDEAIKMYREENNE